MPEHYIQKNILQALVECEGARFAELRPAGVEANAFTYHLQRLMKDGLVEKGDDGQYRLTARGKLAGINLALGAREMLLQAHSIVLVVVREGGEGAAGTRWLLRRRLVQPQYGRVGFMHGEPMAGVPIADAAARILGRRTGLVAREFKLRGSGFVTIRQRGGTTSDGNACGGEIESYTHFVLVEARGLSGELVERDAHGENFWMESPDFSAPEMIGSMAELARLTESCDNVFFAEFDI